MCAQNLVPHVFMNIWNCDTCESIKMLESNLEIEKEKNNNIVISRYAW